MGAHYNFKKLPAGRSSISLCITFLHSYKQEQFFSLKIIGTIANFKTKSNLKHYTEYIKGTLFKQVNLKKPLYWTAHIKGTGPRFSACSLIKLLFCNLSIG